MLRDHACQGVGRSSTTAWTSQRWVRRT